MKKRYLILFGILIIALSMPAVRAMSAEGGAEPIVSGTADATAAATDEAPLPATPTFHAVIFKGVDEKMVKEILPMLSAKLFDIPIVLLDESPEIPKKAYVEANKKYYAGTVLDYIETLKPAGSLGIIGFVDEPIFAGPSPFVDGVGLPDRGVAVLSLAQLKDADYYRYRQRVFGQGLHEMGHVIGLDHDAQPYCVMQETHDIKQLDLREIDFCPYHTQMAVKFLKKKIPDMKPVDPFKEVKQKRADEDKKHEAEQKKARSDDSKPPEMLDIYPNDGATVQSDIKYIRARIVDDGVGVDPSGILLLLDGAQINVNYTESTGELTAIVRNLDPGAHSIELHVQDRANNAMNPYFCSFTVLEP